MSVERDSRLSLRVAITGRCRSEREDHPYLPAAPFPRCRGTASGDLLIVELPRVDQRPTVMRSYKAVVAAAALLVGCSSTPSEPEGACAAPTPGQQAGPCNDFGTGEGPMGG